jgi:subtilisin family serine protease
VSLASICRLILIVVFVLPMSGFAEAPSSPSQKPDESRERDMRSQVLTLEKAILKILAKRGFDMRKVEENAKFYSEHKDYASPDREFAFKGDGLSLEKRLVATGNFLVALTETKYPKPMNGVDEVMLDGRPGANVSAGILLLGGSGESGSWLEGLSSRPDQEPIIKAPHEAKRVYLRAKFLAQLDGFRTTFDLGHKICTEMSNNPRLRHGDFKKLIEGVYSVPVEGVDATEQVTAYNFANTHPRRTLEIKESENGAVCVSYWSANDVSVGIQRRMVNADFMGCLDLGACSYRWIRSVEYRKDPVHPAHSIVRQFSLDESANLADETYLDKPVRSLREVYESKFAAIPRCTAVGDEPTAERAVELARDKDAVVVGLIDSGVDYNHPLLAAHVRRRPNPRIESLKAGVLKARKEEQERASRALKYGGTLLEGRMEKKYREARSHLEAQERALVEARNEPMVVGHDLVGVVGSAYDYWISEATERDQVLNHGTQVASSVLKASVNLILEPVRIDSSSNDRMGEGVDDLVRSRARVINMSLGSEDREFWEPFREAVRRHPEVVFVVAAGNDGRNLDDSGVDSFPTEFREKNLISVASVNAQGELSAFSNYSATSVHLAAMGENVPVAIPHGKACAGRKGYCNDSGTSLAAPYVAGVIGAMLDENPHLKVDQILSILRETVDRTRELESKTVYGGIVNRDRAVARAKALLGK